jgi:hypothetical protein
MIHLRDHATVVATGLREPVHIQHESIDETGSRYRVVQPFTVQVPLEVTDIRPDDQFRVTSSQDPRLITRVLEVTRVKAESMAVKREFTAVDNQG